MTTPFDSFKKALYGSRLEGNTASPDYAHEGSLARHLNPPVCQPTLRISNLISNKTDHLFTLHNLRELDIPSPPQGSLKTADPHLFLTPKPRFIEWFDACFKIHLYTITPTNIADWMLRLNLLTSIDEWPFTSNNSPSIPTFKELSELFGLEVLNARPLDNNEFIDGLVSAINRRVALDMQSRMNDALPSENFLPYNAS